MSTESFKYDSEAVEKALIPYDDEKFKDVVRNTMQIMDSGVVSAAEMIEVIEKVKLQAAESNNE